VIMAIELVENQEPVLLIVDDNPTNLQVLGSILREYRVKIAVAQNGPAALTLAEKLMPDLILLDIMMPEMDGYQVCEKLKSDKKLADIPVVFLSARNETQDIVTGFNVGGVDYVTKPFNQDELIRRIQTHLELKFSRDSLKMLNKFKDKMFSIIGHDLRNPVAAIKMAITVLMKQDLDPNTEDYKRMLKLLSSSTDEALILLENVLTWARNESGMLAVQREAVDIQNLANDVLGLLNGQADMKGVKLQTQIQDKVNVVSDSNMLSTVLRNLVSNAIKFTPKGGNISVEAKNDGDFVTLSVSDTGQGMSKEQIDEIFEQHNRVSTKGTDGESGTGLGLSLCMDFLNKCGGELEIESSEGKGSKFYFKVPSNF